MKNSSYSFVEDGFRAAGPFFDPEKSRERLDSNGSLSLAKTRQDLDYRRSAAIPDNKINKLI